MRDVNGKTIQIGDIVKIEKSPVKSDNALYVVGQDGTSKLYDDKKGLTLYKAVKYKGGYALSAAGYNISFYPLMCFSSRYKFSRAEMDAAAIEIIKKAEPSRMEIIMTGASEPEAGEQDYYYAEVADGKREIVDCSYLVSQADKLTAFFFQYYAKSRAGIENHKTELRLGHSVQERCPL